MLTAKGIACSIKVVVGFFSFLILLCCEASTADFRAALVPVHAAFGLITFLMAIATCVTGLTEKALFVFDGYLVFLAARRPLFFPTKNEPNPWSELMDPYDQRGSFVLVMIHRWR